MSTQRKPKTSLVYGLGLTLAVVAVVGAPRIAGAQDKPAAAPPTTEKTPTADKSRINLASDIKPDALWDGRKIVPFHALDDPKMVKAADADFLDDSDYLLGVVVNGEARAYPTRFVWWHHIINDKGGKAESGGVVPFAVSYCSVCNSGVRFDPVVDGKTIKLDFYGLYNGVVILCDRETESVILQVNGRAVSGPLAGKIVPQKPILDTTWGKWKALHPDTLVMSPDTEYAKHYTPRGKAEPRGYDRFPAPFFRSSMAYGDKRLPPFQKVLGVAISFGKDIEAIRRAYVVQEIETAGGVVNDTVQTMPLVAFLEPDTQTANAFSRRVNGKTLTFEARKQADGKAAFYDKETGTRWNIEGMGEAGTLAGKSLTRLENHLSQWYGWVAYYPQTGVYGHDSPPIPGTFDDYPEPPTAPKADAPNK